MQTKKIVKKKFNIKKLFILLLILYILCYGSYYLFSIPIKNIIISGNTLVSDKEIITTLKIKNYPSILSLKKSKMQKELLKNPLIASVEIKKNINFQLLITIKENKIVLYNKTNNKYLLSNGNSYETTNNIIVPTLINYAPEQTLKNFAVEFAQIDSNIINLISEIEYSPSKNEKNETIDETRFKLKMDDGNTVYINVNNTQILAHYEQIFASLNDKKGIINLDSGTKDNFVFTTYGEKNELQSRNEKNN